MCVQRFDSVFVPWRSLAMIKMVAGRFTRVDAIFQASHTAAHLMPDMKKI